MGYSSRSGKEEEEDNEGSCRMLQLPKPAKVPLDLKLIPADAIPTGGGDPLSWLLDSGLAVRLTTSGGGEKIGEFDSAEDFRARSAALISACIKAKREWTTGGLKQVAKISHWQPFLLEKESFLDIKREEAYCTRRAGYKVIGVYFNGNGGAKLMLGAFGKNPYYVEVSHVQDFFRIIEYRESK